jgi:cyclophilin family peptidyl-prolyl cis-trans isomerase
MPAANPIVEIETTKGTFRAELFADKAPLTAANFLELVQTGYYDGIIFHRVIPNFMVQTGDPTGTGRGGRTAKGLPAKKLQDEFHPSLRHDGPGIFSMANSGPNTGDTQIFITTVPCPWLDKKHAIFGKVISGMEVVHAIEGVPTASDRPVDPPKIVKATVVA